MQLGREATHEEIRAFADQITKAIREITGQKYVDEYAQVVKKRLEASEALKVGEKKENQQDQ